MGHVAMLHHEDGHTARGWGWEGLYTVPVTHPTSPPPKCSSSSIISWPAGGLSHQGCSMWVFRCFINTQGGPTSWGWGWEGVGCGLVWVLPAGSVIIVPVATISSVWAVGAGWLAEWPLPGSSMLDPAAPVRAHVGVRKRARP